MSTLNPVRASLAPYESFPLQDMLRRAVQRDGGKTAVIDGEKSFTFKELDDLSDRFASALAAQGISKGDFVGLLAPNCVEFVIAFYGIIKAGAVATTINSGYREREIAHQLNDSGAQVLIVHQALNDMADAAQDLAKGVNNRIVIVPGSNESGTFWGLIESAPSAVPTPQVNPMEDLVALPYSSGTTGLSKGVMLTHHNLTSNVSQLNDRNEGGVIRGSDVVLVHLPLFHIYGLEVLMNGCIGAGATQVMMGRFDIEEFLGLMSNHKVSMLFTAPPVALGLSQYPGVANYDLSALRVGFIGAAPLSADLQTRVQEKVGFTIIQGYGMTEASPLTNCDFMEPGMQRMGSIGPAVPDTEQKVVDLEDPTREVGVDEIGELMLRGPQVMKGYFNNDQATADTLTEDKWLHTGDIVRMDSDRYVYVLDRKKELIKYKGFQVPPAELEGILLEHPGITDAAVIGKLDEESGEIPKAFVVRAADSEVSDDDVMAFVAGKVATFKHIREVEFIDAVPKNASGKILRRVLIEQERGETVV
ncbi:MAG: AMP-binding protein [SAR202 cluster bacterium]|nr:AMP-binding protein [SAR202 cluster bacterium]